MIMRLCLRLSETAEGSKDAHMLLHPNSAHRSTETVGFVFITNSSPLMDTWLGRRASQCTSHPALSQQYAYAVSLSFPPSQVSYIFVIYIEIQSFLDITGTTSIDLIWYHYICRQRQDFPARHSNVPMQDTIMEVNSQLMWQQMSYISIFHLKVTHSEIPEGLSQPFWVFYCCSELCSQSVLSWCFLAFSR